MNKVILSGHLGQAPELKNTPTGDSVCTFTLATTEKWKDKSGNKQEKTEWHRIVAWKHLADLCSKYLDKGSKILIEGKIATRSWQDKEGNTKYATEITMAQMEFMGRSEGTQSQGTTNNNTSSNKKPAITHSDIPF